MASQDGAVQASKEVLDWLMAGDSSVRYQTLRDLLDDDRPHLQARMVTDGDAATILAAQGPDGHWGRGFYQPKWTSSHYSLLELRDLDVVTGHPACLTAVGLIAQQKGLDGGVNPSGDKRHSDVCVNGMFLAYATHFGAEVAVLMGVIDFLLGQRLDDGGFNCDASRSERRLSSVHTTTSVIDGFAEYLRRGYVYRADEVHLAVTDAAEALLARHLYQRRGDGEPIRTEFTRLHHPARWHFDVLRGLEVLRLAGVDWEPRMVAAMDVVARRRRQDGRWAGSSQYPGQTWVSYPGAGEPNRWVTLRALRVVRWAGAAVRSAGPPAG